MSAHPSTPEFKFTVSDYLKALWWDLRGREPNGMKPNPRNRFLAWAIVFGLITTIVSGTLLAIRLPVLLEMVRSL